MIATFSALLLAHVLADFVFQTADMAANKRRPRVFALHILIVLALTCAILGAATEAVLAVAAAHLVIDAVKTWALPRHIHDTLTAYLGDQAAHLATLAAAALLWPGAAATGLWAPWLDLFTGPAIGLAGAIVTILAGGHAVGLLMRPYQDAALPEGLPRAGRVIGQLERGLILLLVLSGQPAGIGFLIAAKSILRFDTAREDQKAGEYVIIGTLASFGWALAAAFATQALLELAATSS